ncbi:1473_t:CDS:2, partial [Dentiscutata heterogama]
MSRFGQSSHSQFATAKLGSLTSRSIYFGKDAFKAGFWSLKHYVDWIIKNGSELPLWKTCLADFYGSSKLIVSLRSLPRLDRVVAEKILKAKELPKTKKLIEDLRIPYERAYDGKYGKSIYKSDSSACATGREYICFSEQKNANEKGEGLGEECVSKNENCLLISEESEFFPNDYNKENVDDEDEFDVMDKNLYTKRKWKLESGRFVEDVLYELGMKCRYYNLVHSFILDPTDEFIKNVFKEEELSEIIKKGNGNDPLEIDDEIL